MSKKVVLIRQFEALTKKVFPDAVKNSSLLMYDKNTMLDLIANEALKAKKSDNLRNANWWSWAYNSGKKDITEYDFIIKHSLQDQLASIVVRILILSKVFGLDIEEAVKAKIKHNKERRFDYEKEN